MGSSQTRRAYLALASVCFFWGTTYLGIRMSLESFPPIKLLCIRFLISGTLALAVAMMIGKKLPPMREILWTSLFGLMMLGGGTGGLIFAETFIPSGIAALFITTQPFWMVGLETLLPGGDRFHLPTLGGILVGFCGVLILFAPGANADQSAANLFKGFLLLQVTCAFWCSGAILQRRQRTQAHPFMSGAIQQLATGIAAIPLLLLVPEPAIQLSDRGLLAMGWLVVFGSIVGFSSFIYAMEHLPVAVVSIYTFVNPLVAVSLGWLFYREPFGWREAAALVLVFAGVGLVKYYGANTRQRPVQKAARA